MRLSERVKVSWVARRCTPFHVKWDLNDPKQCQEQTQIFRGPCLRWGSTVDSLTHHMALPLRSVMGFSMGLKYILYSAVKSIGLLRIERDVEIQDSS